MTGAVLVTGAASGLGLATARCLARAGVPTVLACRSAERGAAAAGAVREAVPGARVDTVVADLGSLASVRAAAAELAAGPPLAALVANAGVQVVGGVRRSADGHELVFATNHLGHFLLVRLLAEHLAVPGRVVVVSSETHAGPRRSLGFPAPRWQHPRRLADADAAAADPSSRAGRVRYATSKLAALYLVHELARRFPPERLTANAFDPGLMPETGLARDYPPLVRRAYRACTPLLVRALPGASPVERSAADLAWLATDPSVAGVTGEYFRGREPRRSSPESYDEGRAAELWQVSDELVGLAAAGRPGP